MSTEGAITSVSVERESQDEMGSFPGWANLWTVSVPPYPLQTERGIGRLLNVADIHTDVANKAFTVHGHRYDAPFIPAASARVTYAFDVPTVVGELEVIQHMNGISVIEGFVGDSLDAMTSIGTAASQRGDVTGGEPFSEGEHSIFAFTNRRPALFFRFMILKTRLADGYAAYRAFPRKPSDARIEPAAVAVVAQPPARREINWVIAVSIANLTVLLGVVIVLWRGRNQRHRTERDHAPVERT